MPTKYGVWLNVNGDTALVYSPSVAVIYHQDEQLIGTLVDIAKLSDKVALFYFVDARTGRQYLLRWLNHRSHNRIMSPSLPPFTDDEAIYRIRKL